MLQPPIDFELETVDLRLISELPDEEGVDRDRVAADDILGKRAEQDLVWRMVLKRKLIDGAKG